jgi:hypothetical protein
MSRVSAEQVCPELWNALRIADLTIACRFSASSRTTFGDLPPSSSRHPLDAAGGQLGKSVKHQVGLDTAPTLRRPRAVSEDA